MTKPKNLDECAELVRKKEPFKFTNVFADFRPEYLPTRCPPRYVVFSYGHHYPMYVYDYEACQWFGNADKSTPTTQRHKRKFQPYSVAQWVDTATLNSIAVSGIVNTTAERMEYGTQERTN